MNRRLLLILGTITIVTACGGGSSELVVRGEGGPGGSCEYDGPSEISNGSIELLVSPSGLGHILAVIYEIEGDPPEGQIDENNLGAIVATVESEDEIDLSRRSEQLEPGRYAIACVYGDFDAVVGTLEVSP